MLSIILAIPVSVALLVWIWRMKQFNPFPKGTFVKLLVGGLIALILSSIITIVGAVGFLIIQIGPDQLKQLMDAESAVKVIQQITEAAKSVSSDALIFAFLRTFVLVGLVEELLKFVCAKVVMRKEGVVYTWMDALLCFAVVAIGFQLIEDMQYAEGSIITAIVRALTPFHFTFGVIMGYFYGLGKVKGKWYYNILAIVVPALIHTMFDFSVSVINRNEDFIVLTLVMGVVMFVLTILAVLKLRKWHKEGTLDLLI